MSRYECCDTHEGQYRNVLYRPNAQVGRCRVCDRMFHRNPDLYGRLDWIPDTYEIEELP